MKYAWVNVNLNYLIRPQRIRERLTPGAGMTPVVALADQDQRGSGTLPCAAGSTQGP